MCGISVLFHQQSLSSNLFEKFLVSLKKIDHRGPDDEGVILINTKSGNYKIIRTDKTHPEVKNAVEINDISLSDYNLILGHKRLSIVDLSIHGHQPMQGKDGSWLVFNGEIYNYIELREELKLLGSHFISSSDTEVLLEAYRIWGTDCLNKFNGMWSFCLWDNTNKKIFISNDRFGVKSLYYISNTDNFTLFSETKQYAYSQEDAGPINNKYIQDFSEFGLIDIGQQTIYSKIYRFRKSHYIVIDPIKIDNNIFTKCVQYYKVKKKAVLFNFSEAVEKYNYLLNSAVSLRMRSDVDYGFALSGGLDSSTIIASAKNILLKENKSNKIKTFSAVFPGHFNSDESNFINLVTDHFKLDSKLINPFDRFNFTDFETHVYHQDKPLQTTSYFAQWSVYWLAKKNKIKVLLNGQGADELFAGYHHHFYRYSRYLLTRGKIREYFSLVKAYSFIKGIDSKKIHKIIFNEVRLSLQIKLKIKKFDNLLLKHFNEIDNLDELLVFDFDTYLLPTYLRADDRDSMAFGIESRHPFMDYRMVEFGYSLPNSFIIKDGWQKYIMREAKIDLPKEILYRKDKKGFTTPQEIWLKKFKSEFDLYLEYNKTVLGKERFSTDIFRDYSLGAWLKVNLIK